MEDVLSRKSRHLLKQMTITKAQYILSKSQVHEQDVYSLIKEFFKEFLQAKYEFTIDELIEELKKIYLESHVWKKLKPFLERISLIEYSDKKYSEADLIVIIKEFVLLLSIIITAKLPKKLSWHKKLKRIILRNKEESLEGLENIRINTAETNEIYDEVENAFLKQNEQEKLAGAEAGDAAAIIQGDADTAAMETMNSLIKEISSCMDSSNLAEAKKLYKQLQKAYGAAGNETQKDYYIVINKLYEKLA